VLLIYPLKPQPSPSPAPPASQGWDVEISVR
jgi:hypothetical protein